MEETTHPEMNIWPQVSDVRLLELLDLQIEGSLDVLQMRVEDGLEKLTDALDRHPVPEIEGDILAVFTDFQNIDRVVQRLGNVRKCLLAWRESAHNETASDSNPAWAGAAAKLYVMQEEHITQNQVLNANGQGESNG